MRVLYAPVLFLLFVTSVNGQSNMLTARQHFETINAQIIADHPADTRLFMAMALYTFAGYPVALDFEEGKAELWIYGFLSASDQSLITAVATESETLGTMIGVLGAQEWPEGADSIYTRLTNGWWMNSDSAAAVWQTTGMRDFLDARPASSVLGFMLAPGLHSSAEWAVVAADVSDTLSCSIDAYTAEAYECVTSTALESISSATDFSLGAIHPNPVRSGAIAEVELTTASTGNISIEVFDAQGRQQGYVLDEYISPGAKKIIIPSELIRRPGVYFIQARSQNGVSTRKLVVSR